MTERLRSWLKRGATLTCLALTALAALPCRASEIKSDEEIVFFPTAARLAADGAAWVLPIHAWVFEPEAESLWRRATLKALTESLGLEEEDTASDIFKRRARWLMVDNERGKSLKITLAPGAFLPGVTAANGQLKSELRLTRLAPGEEPASRWLEFTARLPDGDDRSFQGRIQLVAPRGLSVISDIDDTVKVSEVTDKRALLVNSFLKPFAAVPGMAEAYGRWAAGGAVFHYVSSSPWQFYPELADFMAAAGLPAGSFHLRAFRFRDESFFNLFASSEETKPPQIEALLAAFPGRDFILVGDSGEKDPEIYGEIARKHPGRIAAIYIRRVTPEAAEDARYLEAFADLPPGLWLLFDDPAILADLP